MADFFKDLRLTARAFDRLTSDREYVDLVVKPGSKDIDTIDGRANLAQAIINRLLTRRGELSALGHPGYGSRLYELVGEPNNIRLRGRAEIYIRDCLAQERRIEKVVQVAFAPPVRNFGRDELPVFITVKPLGEDKEITVNLNI